MADALIDEDREPLEFVRELLEAGDEDALHAFLVALPHPSDVAALLDQLDEDDRVRVLVALTDEPALAAEALAEMEPDEHPEDSLAALGSEQIAAVVAELSDDDAADMIGEMDKEDQDRVLAALPSEDAGDIRDLMRYHEETAGGIMTTELVAVRAHLLAGQAIEEVRRQAQEVGDFYVVFVVDDNYHLLGWLPLPKLVVASPTTPIERLIEPPIAAVLPDMDQEEVGRVVARYNLTVVPVVDEDGLLLGGVTFDDVIDIIEAESTEDILKLGGTSDQEEIRGGWWDAVRSRLPWLCLNIVTASAGAMVVLQFEKTISDLAVLAVIMPIVAGMGGNSGTQALAVTVRRLALSQDRESDHRRIIGKELLVGLGNGLVIGLIVSTLVVLVKGDVRLGMVVMAAMWMNLTVGSFAGAFVPIVLERFGIDPAIASSMFVTAFTDMCGFLLLLGLATKMLL